MKKGGSCIRGDRCPYAHNVFEYWLHPTRYRTQLCNDGPVCRRAICFFAHSLDELRAPAHKPYVSPEALARASLEAIQQNPHPLSAQVSLSSASMSQEAALAALTGAQFDYLPSSAIPHHTHTGPMPPRLSQDYGSLPRWSDNSNRAYQQRVSLDAARRRSFALSDASTPARLSIDSQFHLWEAATSMPQPHVDNPTVVVEGPEQWSGGTGSRSSTGGSRSGAGSPALQGVNNKNNNDGGAVKEAVLSQSPATTKAVAGTGSVGDDELAQSLATLKIALTQQNAASTAASNHEVVISTLHQILRDAVAQQSGGAAAASHDDARTLAAYAALSGLAGQNGFGSLAGSATVSDASGETPARLSLDTSSPPIMGAGMMGSMQGGQHDGDGMHAEESTGDGGYPGLSNDLVRALE